MEYVAKLVHHYLFDMAIDFMLNFETYLLMWNRDEESIDNYIPSLNLYFQTISND